MNEPVIPERMSLTKPGGGGRLGSFGGGGGKLGFRASNALASI
jgi:hypothetical protein